VQYLRVLTRDGAPFGGIIEEADNSKKGSSLASTRVFREDTGGSVSTENKLFDYGGPCFTLGDKRCRG